MRIDTHTKIDAELCGTPLEVGKGFSRVEFRAMDRMAVDESGLVHGGFVFGLADYAAMIAVNHPNVVLGAAEVRFLLPVRTDDILLAEARVVESEGKKQKVKVSVQIMGQTVFEGEFTCFVLKNHVLG
ncbi:MAG: PaaI family thioesterase [Desulfobacteraceae bacterium]|nr:PaaI family thioesterase [Desulfobacteraceae bacterium]